MEFSLPNHVTRKGVLFIAMMITPVCLLQTIHYANWHAGAGVNL